MYTWFWLWNYFTKIFLRTDLKNDLIFENLFKMCKNTCFSHMYFLKNIHHNATNVVSEKQRNSRTVHSSQRDPKSESFSIVIWWCVEGSEKGPLKVIALDLRVSSSFELGWQWVVVAQFTTCSDEFGSCGDGFEPVVTDLISACVGIRICSFWQALTILPATLRISSRDHDEREPHNLIADYTSPLVCKIRTSKHVMFEH